MEIKFKLAIILFIIKINLINGSNNRKSTDISNNNIADMRMVKSPKFIQVFIINYENGTYKEYHYTSLFLFLITMFIN